MIRCYLCTLIYVPVRSTAGVGGDHFLLLVQAGNLGGLAFPLFMTTGWVWDGSLYGHGNRVNLHIWHLWGWEVVRYTVGRRTDTCASASTQYERILIAVDTNIKKTSNTISSLSHLSSPTGGESTARRLFSSPSHPHQDQGLQRLQADFPTGRSGLHGPKRQKRHKEQ